MLYAKVITSLYDILAYSRRICIKKAIKKKLRSKKQSGNHDKKEVDLLVAKDKYL
jgi:hypothetical protein